jgi:hypothetical protein
MIFLESGGDRRDDKGAGDGKSLWSVWQSGHNWREGKALSGDAVWGKGWIPPTPSDTRLDHIEGIERNPKHPDFLRPASTSPLATQGAGSDDPHLPRYVGAVPPEGVALWDWEKTFHTLRARP